MVLGLEVLNSNASLNNFFSIGSAQIVKGSSADLVLRLIQLDLDLRFIPSASATMTLELNKSDGTQLVKTLSNPFSDDRSVVKASLSPTETTDLISQKLIVKLDVSGVITYALLNAGLQMVPLSQDC